ncbi:MAG: fluoride exporter [Solirubrobacteraceae bacterium]|nr:fluoride exporter [Solirubrobacteraceae bacterium]
MSVWTWFGVALLGGVGTAARFFVVALVSSRTGGSPPLGVLAVNASGSLLLGLLAGLTVGASLLVLAGSATLGSYTTFSTWMLETQRLAEDARRWAAVANVLVSLLVGVAAIVLGRKIGAQLG